MKVDELQVGELQEDVEGNKDNITLLFFLKGLESLHQERRGHVKTIVMEHFNSILFHKSGSANKQHTYQLIIKSSYIYSSKNIKIKLEDSLLLVGFFALQLPCH